MFKPTEKLTHSYIAGIEIFLDWPSIETDMLLNK